MEVTITDYQRNSFERLVKRQSLQHNSTDIIITVPCHTQITLSVKVDQQKQVRALNVLLILKCGATDQIRKRQKLQPKTSSVSIIIFTPFPVSKIPAFTLMHVSISINASKGIHTLSLASLRRSSNSEKLKLATVMKSLMTGTNLSPDSRMRLF